MKYLKLFFKISFKCLKSILAAHYRASGANQSMFSSQEKSFDEKVIDGTIHLDANLPGSTAHHISTGQI